MANMDVRLRAVEAFDPGAVEPCLREVPRPAGIDVARPVRSLTPYEAVSSQGAIGAHAAQDVFKLDWNESTIAPSPKVREAIAEYMTRSGGLNWYPTLGSRNLLDALGEYTGLTSDKLLATNGSDDGLHLICSTYLDHGDDVVVPVPTYNHFVVFAQSRGANIIRVQADSPFDPNLDGIRAAMSPSTRLVYLVSPNNPTGIVYRPEQVERLCQDFPNTLVVLDEAYFEFAQISGMSLVGRYPNLIVTRTFSKAFGLAGLRVGYLGAHPAIVEGLHRIYNPKSVNTLGQIGAIAALNDLPYLDAFLAEVIEAKTLLADFFEARDVDAHITPANFVVVRCADIGATLNALEARGVYVRDRSSYPGLAGCLRMTVGTVEQTKRLMARLAEVF